jgi:hypothetical protein
MMNFIIHEFATWFGSCPIFNLKFFSQNFARIFLCVSIYSSIGIGFIYLFFYFNNQEIKWMLKLKVSASLFSD